MVRIPDDELERVKRATDLVVLVQATGGTLQRHGANVIGRCPFHDDQGPSVVVSQRRIFGTVSEPAKAGGSVIDWVMRAECVSFRQAVELLRIRLGGGDATRTAPVSLAPRVSSVTEAQALYDATLVREVLDVYHATLTASPEAIAYLEQRGLNSPALIARFQLGYANRTLAYRLPATSRKAGAEVRGRMNSWGSCARVAMTIFGAASRSRFFTPTARSRSVTSGRSGRNCVRARHCICISRGRIRPCHFHYGGDSVRLSAFRCRTHGSLRLEFYRDDADAHIDRIIRYQKEKFSSTPRSSTGSFRSIGTRFETSHSWTDRENLFNT